MQGSCAQEEGKNSSSQTAPETQIFTLQAVLPPYSSHCPQGSEEVKIWGQREWSFGFHSWPDNSTPADCSGRINKSETYLSVLGAWEIKVLVTCWRSVPSLISNAFFHTWWHSKVRWGLFMISKIICVWVLQHACAHVAKNWRTTWVLFSSM